MKLKHALALAILAASATAAVAAPDVYRVTATESFSTNNVYKIDTYQGDVRFVRVTYLNGSESSYKDLDGLLDRILENQDEFTRVTGTGTYVNALYLGRTACNTGKSVAFLQNSVITLQATDNCVMANEIARKAK